MHHPPALSLPSLLAVLGLLLTVGCGDPAPATRLDTSPEQDVGDDAAGDTTDPGNDTSDDASQPSDGGDVLDTTDARDTTPDTELADAEPPDTTPDDTDQDVSDAEADAIPDGPWPDLVLNEIECRGQEWVEVLNRSDVVAVLDGWGLTDRPDDPDRLYLLSGTLEPGAWMVWPAGEQATFDFRLDCDTETVTLLNPRGDVADSAALDGALPADATLSRLPDGDGAWGAGRPTPGAPNVAWEDPRDALFDPARVSTIEFTLSELDFALLGAFPQEYAEATMRFIDHEGVAAPVQTVGLRIKGRYGSFRPLGQKSAFKVRFNWPTSDVADFRGLRRLTLNNMVQDPSKLHEWTAYTIFRAVGVPAPRVGYARVRVNGEDYGLYANVETVDAIALADDFGGTSHLYEGSYGQDLAWEHLYNLETDEGVEVDRRDLIDLIARVENASDEAFYDTLAERVDWAEMLAMMAVEIFIGHWDGYAPTRNNYYLHFDDAGIARLLPWGTDQTFDAWLAPHQGGGRLFARCMASPRCRIAYDEALIQVVATIGTLDLPARIQALADQLRPLIEADPKLEYGMDAVLAWQAHTIDFLTQRLAATSELIACLEHRDDPDMDGFICDQDCAPDDPTVHPGAPDLCGDRIDQDCNGWADDAPECPDCVELPTSPHRTWNCPRPRNYPDARANCLTLGDDVDLAIIDTPEENEALWLEAQRSRRQLYWIGLDDQAAEGLFTWIDGTTPTTYSAWAGGEPNNAGGNEDCAHFWEAEPTWNDIPCDVQMGSICEERPPL